MSHKRIYFICIMNSRGKRKRKSTAGERKGQVKWLTKEQKTLIAKVNKWVSAAVSREKNKQAVFTHTSPTRITSEICGISERHVYRVKKDEESSSDDDGGRVCDASPRGRPKIKIDDFNKNALCRLIHSFYIRPRPEIPTLDKIHQEALRIPGFPEVSRTKIYNEIKKLGFVCKKRNKKMNVYQRLDIVANRQEYLRKIRQYRKDGYEIFYQDETWCNQNHTREYIWQEQTDGEALIPNVSSKGGLKVPSGKGRRLIINHLGSKNGFLKDSGECFVGKKDSADYHNEMNGDHFENWLVEKVFPNLPNKAVISLDNARYHSRQTEDSKTPTTTWRKAQIQEWLRKMKINFDDAKDTKPILLAKCKSVFIPKKYVIEKLAKEYCEKNNKDLQILRLPIGHSELNPIELIWAQVKSEVARKNVTFKMKDVQNLVNESLGNVTASNWAKAEKHSIKVENEFWKIDFKESEASERFIIELRDSDDDTDESDESGNEFDEDVE